MRDDNFVLVKRLPLRVCKVDMIPSSRLTEEFDSREREGNE